MIILGSQSVARKNLIKIYNSEIDIIEANIDEKYDNNKSIYENVVDIATQKAEYILNKYNNTHNLNDKILLCADTVVLNNGAVLFKPNSYDEAYNAIKSYSNEKVEVVTGVYLKYKDEIHQFYDSSYVSFSNIDESNIDSYLSENDYLSISGGLDINTINKYFEYEIIGSYSNIIGLPLEKITTILSESFDYNIDKHIDVFRATVRTFPKLNDKYYLLKCYTLDKKHIAYCSIGGGYHKFDDKIETIKKEALEEGGFIIDNINFIGNANEFASLKRFIQYNKLTHHVYYSSDVIGFGDVNYIDYENDVILGVEAFTRDELINLLEKQVEYFKPLTNYPFYQASMIDLEMVKRLK